MVAALKLETNYHSIEEDEKEVQDRNAVEANIAHVRAWHELLFSL